MNPATASILVAVITGICTVLGVIITNRTANTKIQTDLKQSQAVQEEKIVELTREVRKHNDFAERIPRIEEKINHMEKRIDTLERRN